MLFRSIVVSIRVGTGAAPSRDDPSGASDAFSSRECARSRSHITPGAGDREGAPRAAWCLARHRAGSGSRSRSRSTSASATNARIDTRRGRRSLPCAQRRTSTRELRQRTRRSRSQIAHNRRRRIASMLVRTLAAGPSGMSTRSWFEPAASFFDRIEAVMSGIDSTVAVTSRIA